MEPSAAVGGSIKLLGWETVSGRRVPRRGVVNGAGGAGPAAVCPRAPAAGAAAVTRVMNGDAGAVSRAPCPGRRSLGPWRVWVRGAGSFPPRQPGRGCGGAPSPPPTPRREVRSEGGKVHTANLPECAPRGQVGGAGRPFESPRGVADPPPCLYLTMLRFNQKAPVEAAGSPRRGGSGPGGSLRPGPQGRPGPGPGPERARGARGTDGGRAAAPPTPARPAPAPAKPRVRGGRPGFVWAGRGRGRRIKIPGAPPWPRRASPETALGYYCQVPLTLYFCPFIYYN